MAHLKYFFTVLILISTTGLFAQKKVIDHQAFDSWNTLKNEKISNKGKYISYEIAPLIGDTYLYIFNTESGQLDSIKRAKNATFSSDENYLIYTIEAGYDTLRRVELDKVDKKKWPKDSLAIYSFATQKTIKFSNVKSHATSEHHNWVSILENDNDLKEPKPTILAKKKKSKVEEKPAKAPKSDGKVMRLYHLTDGTSIAFKNVTEHEIDKNAHRMVYTTHQNDSVYVNILELSNFKHSIIDSVFKGVTKMVVDSVKTQMVFLASQDTTKTKVFTLYHYDFASNSLKNLVDTNKTEIPASWTVVSNKAPQFSPNGEQLFFGVYNRPQPEKKDTLLEKEKPKFDLWHYNESTLQTEQIAQLKRESSKAYMYAYQFDSGKIIELENDTISIQRNFYEQKQFALGSNSKPYEKNYMWDISGAKDYYSIDMKTGEKTLLKKEVTSAIPLSRSENIFVYFNEKDGQYYAIELGSTTEKCITCHEEGKTWSGDKNGMPMNEYPIGNFGWNKEGTQLYLAEKNDFFAYDFSKNELINLSQEIGAKNKVEFSAKIWHRDSTFAEINNFYLVGLDKITKGSHLYFFENGELVKKGYWDAKITSVKKAKNAELYTIRKQTVTDYPDLEYYKKDMPKLQKISNTNPQQGEYNWATVELINWTTYNGLELEGLVYKPENFDATKKYPLLVYFYELYSDDLHNHYTPRPTASIIFPTEYASGDYIVFIPDIRYKPGYPARGAYDCIMSGTDAVLKKYSNIDSTRMGLQGQSWGGYQTAQLITMTNRYKAAMAGAPVGNMFSAFGGIRWGTGMSRQFQYEKTQSRIGKNIWEAPELYIENSPIFHLPKVNTPLLMMHNDEDGAVPWYQGIELFTGLRRLGKPTWLLNYNGDDHNLMKPANRRDLSIRMRQFFDHYLLEKPAPLWLKEGIPANKKGKELRYELD